MSKHNMNKYSDIFGRKIGVFGYQAIWSLFFIYQIFGKNFDLSNIILYNNKNKIKKDYTDEKITFIFLVTTHPSAFCKDILHSTNSIIKHKLNYLARGITTINYDKPKEFIYQSVSEDAIMWVNWREKIISDPFSNRNNTNLSLLYI